MKTKAQVIAISDHSVTVGPLLGNLKDKVFGLYTERCDYFLANPPAADWNGVWVLKDK